MTTPEPRGLLNWWQGLILAASSALIGLVVALFVLKPAGAGAAPNAPSWAVQLLRFVPHFLMLFGILADAFTYEGVYWTGTAVGLISTFIGPLISTAIGNLFGAIKAQMRATRGGAEPGEYDGLKMLAMQDPMNSGTPETLIVTASILSYYIFDLITNLSMLDAAGAIVAAALLFGGQAFAITGGSDKAAFSGMLGILIGGCFFGLVTAAAPGFLPSSAIPGSKTSGAAGGAAGVGRAGAGALGTGALGANTPTAGGPASAPTPCPR